MSLRAFEFDRRIKADSGYQRHHLIPVKVIGHPAFAGVFASVRSTGFDPCDFATNGLLLPASEAKAMETGLPLHRGPHPRYTELVAEHLDVLHRECPAADAPIQLAIALSRLQGRLRRSLVSTEPAMCLNRRDPRDGLSGFTRLDADLRALTMADYLS